MRVQPTNKPVNADLTATEPHFIQVLRQEDGLLEVNFCD